MTEDCVNGVWGMQPPPKFKNHNGLTAALYIYIVSFKLWEPTKIIFNYSLLYKFISSTCKYN